MKHSDERFNYFDDWSQEMSDNDSHLVPVVLRGHLLIASWNVILTLPAQNKQSHPDPCGRIFMNSYWIVKIWFAHLNLFSLLIHR